MSSTPFDHPALVARRERLAAALALDEELLLVGAGEAIGIPGGQDQTYPFLAHSEYVVLTDRNEPGGIVAFDAHDGWVDFVPVVTSGERIWEGRDQSPGTPLTELAGWLAARRGRPIAALGVAPAGVSVDAALRERFTHARRAKDSFELDRMRRAATATAVGFAAAREALAGTAPSEHRVKVEIEAAFGRLGATRPGYGTIVGFGDHAAILHVEPSQRIAREGELCLIDAGAEIDRYCVDVTRTIAIGAVDGARRELHAIVLRAMQRAIAGCTVGTEWIDLHVRTARDLAEGLIAMNVLRTSIDGAIETGAITLFFPHGLGHLVGLGVRDGSGRLPGRAARSVPGVATIRCDFPLEAGYTITVEPGCYFIPALLNDPQRRERHRDDVDWSVVDRLLEDAVGGVRMEDTIHVTPEGPENLTMGIPTSL